MNDEDEIVWADELPPRGGGHIKWTADAYQLAMTQPGRWARVRYFENAGSCRRTVSHINNNDGGPLTTPPPGHWEAASRTEGRGAWLWLKYEPESVDNQPVTPNNSTTKSGQLTVLSTRSPHATSGPLTA